MQKRSEWRIMAALIFLLALGLTLYPWIAVHYNASHRSELELDYMQIMEHMPDAERDQIRQNAVAYNRALLPGVYDAYSKDLLTWAAESYAEQLDVAGIGIMGYIQIPSIRVQLPIYHGTTEATLSVGAGHLLGSSLPVGGIGTHTVITGHSGMATRKLFSDLPQLDPGDIFFLDVLGERLAYEVEELYTVLPYDTSLLEIEPDQDLCTLVTCTPYAVNTHRLLVRGHRIPYTAEVEETAAWAETSQTGSNWEQQYLKGIYLGIGLVTVMGGIAGAIYGVRRRRCG